MVFDRLRLTNVWDFRKGMAYKKPNPRKINPIEITFMLVIARHEAILKR